MNNKITFTVFSDLHYKKGMYLASVSDLEAVLDRANSSNSDFVIHCGDFCNDYKGSPELVNAFINNKEGLSVYGVYGNHELETQGNTMQYVTPLLTNKVDEVVWGSENGKINNGDIAYYYFDKNNFRIICLDTNFSYNSELDEWQHNIEASWGPLNGNLYPNSLGPTQFKWFEKLISLSAEEGKRCIIVSHSPYNPNWSNPYSFEDVFKTIKNINDTHPGTVLMCLNGHIHANRLGVNEDIVFLNVNTVINGYWTENGFEHYNDEHTFNNVNYNEKGEVVSIVETPLNTLWMSKKTWFFNAPLSAVITITDDGKIEIEGSKSNWIYDIAPENVSAMRCPKIYDFSIDLKI